MLDGLCGVASASGDHVESAGEHLEAVLELVLVMLLTWPDDACPICRYFDCEMPDLDDEMSEVTDWRAGRGSSTAPR